MNLKQLEVFLAVAETGSFSRGAEITCITQSTVSQHIAALEQEFGLKLLDRTGKGALLTEGGKILMRQAQKLMNDVREIRQSMESFKGIHDVNLVIGGSSIPGSYLLPSALSLLADRFPGLKITMLQGDSREILEKIEREEVEIGVVGDRFEEEGFAFTPLGRDEIRLVVNRNHPLSSRKKVRFDDLAEENFIMRERGSGTGRTVNTALQSAGLDIQQLKIRAWLGSNEAVKHAVLSGLGISFLSLVSVQKEIERGDLTAVPVEGLDICRQFYLTSRAGRELSPAATAFAEIMQEICGESSF